MYKVSIIVPVYNTDEFLDDCINSIIKQTHTNIEIILIDDGSTDNSANVIKKYTAEDSRIKLITNEKCYGVGAARNQGLEAAVGDYLYFVDSDDLLHEDAIRVLVERVNGNTLISGSIQQMRNQDDIDQFTQSKNMNVKKKKSTQNFKNRSILKVLISREFIIKNNLSFCENVAIYSEYPIMYSIISKFKKVKYARNSRYFKRKRNDPINNPALTQVERFEKIKDYLEMYILEEEKWRNISRMKKIVDRDFLNFYRKTIVMYMKNPNQFHEIFPLLSRSATRLSEAHYKSLNIVVRKEIKALINEDKDKFESLLKFHHHLRLVKRSIGNKRVFYTYLYDHLFCKLKMKKNWVVYESFLGKNFSDNPKYIYMYLSENYPDYLNIWIYRDEPFNIPGNVKQVKRFSLKYYYYLARSKYWVFNSRLPKHVSKRGGTVYLQTWHGTPLKTLVFDIKDIYSADPNYKKNVYEQSRRWDYLISPNAYSSDIFRRAFKFDKEMLEYGYPRNDILYQGDKETVDKIKEKVGVPQDKKVILYAPTWRDDQFYERGKYKFELELNLGKMQEELSDEYIVVLRLHYHVASVLDVTPYEGFAYDLSSYDDIAELYLISDLLITDYSSVFFDYANLKRPMLFYTYDLEDYRDKIRGLYFDIEKNVPGPLLYTTDEVIKAIKNLDQIQAQYAQQYEDFYKKFCEWEDGRAAEKVVEHVFK